jgi:hypothetical protein
MLANSGTSLLQSTVVAAFVAGAVSLSALWVAGRRARQDRQRQLFAAAFEACIAYREFPYIVRRRRGDDAAAERVRISGELSEVQRRLESYNAMIRVEGPKRERVVLGARGRDAEDCRAADQCWMGSTAARDR